jgi:dolichol-phosphate mannosyltransferase
MDMARNSAGGQGALICVPTYNEAENIAPLAAAVLVHAPLAHILIADDNSPDGTGEIADRLSAEEARIHVLHRPGKNGLAKAYLASFDWALARDYKYIFEFDADFSHDPVYIPRFYTLLSRGVADVVVGSRQVGEGGTENWPSHRRLISRAGNLYARIVLQVPVRDLTGGFNAYTREALMTILRDGVSSVGYCFQIELKYRAIRNGLVVKEEPIIFRDRVMGKSKMNFSIVLEGLRQVVKLKSSGRWDRRPN